MTSLITDSVCVIYLLPLAMAFTQSWSFQNPPSVTLICNPSYSLPPSVLHLCLSSSQRSFSLFFKTRWSQKGIYSHCSPVWDLEDLKGQSTSVTLFSLWLEDRECKRQELSFLPDLLWRTSKYTICFDILRAVPRLYMVWAVKCLIRIKHTCHSHIMFMTRKHICSAAACKCSHLEFIS